VGLATGTAEKVPIFLNRHSDSAALPMLILVSIHKYLDALAERVMQVEVYGHQNVDPGGLRTCDFACTASYAAGVLVGTFEVAALDGRPLSCRGSRG
jgi:hypothetical protein